MQGHNTASEVIGSRKPIYYTQDSALSIRPYYSLQPVQKTICYQSHSC